MSPPGHNHRTLKWLSSLTASAPPSTHHCDEAESSVNGHAINSTQYISMSEPRMSVSGRSRKRLCLDDDVELLASTATSTKSRPSRQLSPSKLTAIAETSQTAYGLSDFSGENGPLPPSLQALCKKLEDIEAFDGIFPTRLKEQLANCGSRSFWFSDSDYTTALDQRWDFPSVELLGPIMKRAGECKRDGEHESSWNLDVHAPMLKLVFRNDSKKKHMVDFRYCPTAPILFEFESPDLPSRKVDFCLHFTPQLNSDDATTITNLRKLRPELSINHTDYANLRFSPIFMSLETKQDGEGAKTAEIQLGIWVSAHWRSLFYFSANRKTIDGIEFLPLLLIQGHNWYFAASTRNSQTGKAILHMKMSLGTTETLKGSYQILYSLLVIRCWAEDEFWPSLIKHFRDVWQQLSATSLRVDERHAGNSVGEVDG